jgi:folate-binding protein YgfZ
MKIITHDWHKSHGAVFEDFFGCEIPSHYGSQEEEYSSLRKSVGIRDVSYFGKVKITGKDRQKFLHGMISNDVKSLLPGQGVHALFLDVKGHIQGDFKIYAYPEHLLMVLQHFVRDKVVSGLDRYIISEDVKMKDATEDLAMIQIIGPKADAFLQSKGIATFPSQRLSFVTISLSGQEAQLIRLGVGYGLICPTNSAPSILQNLDAKLVGWKAFNIFRVESGMAVQNLDIDETNFPQECGLEEALNFNKGCYLGQEVMARIDAQGHVNKRLMGIATASLLKTGDRLYKGGKEIGKVTSPVFSILLDQSFALGYVRREFANEGETLEAGDDRTTGIVRKLPLQA